MILVVLAAAGGGFMYVKALQKDLDTAKAKVEGRFKISSFLSTTPVT